MWIQPNSYFDPDSSLSATLSRFDCTFNRVIPALYITNYAHTSWFASLLNSVLTNCLWETIRIFGTEHTLYCWGISQSLTVLSAVCTDCQHLSTLVDWLMSYSDIYDIAWYSIIWKAISPDADLVLKSAHGWKWFRKCENRWLFSCTVVSGFNLNLQETSEAIKTEIKVRAKLSWHTHSIIVG